MNRISGSKTVAVPYSRNNTLAAYTYTDEGYVDTITQPGAVTTFTHDNAGRILTQTAKDNDNHILVADTFTYDTAGNITHKTETRGDETWDIDYTYTTDHRLSGYTIKQGNTTLQTVAFQYDTAGNRTKETRTAGDQTTTIDYTYNNFNQLVSSTTTHPDTTTATASYEYDQAGRLTAEHAETAEGEEVKTYGYNAFGHLVSVASTTPQATSEASYQYAYDGKRISKYLNGTLYDYTYTGNNLLETYADTAGRIAKYTYGHALISQSDATGSSESVVTDYQNSVVALLPPTPTPTLFAYNPFGKLRYTNNPDSPQTLGWLSRQFDSETGNNYLINRYYNADRGSFLSPDRYQYVNNATPFTFNLYQYGYANPLVNVDPEGLRIEDKDGQRYHAIEAVNGTEVWIPQAYYNRLNQMVGNDSGTLQMTGPDGRIVTLNLSASDLKNGTVATRVMEGRMLQLYDEERALDAVQITTAAAEFSSNFVAAAVSVPGMGALMRMKWLAAGLGAYTAGTMSHHFGERLAERQESGSNVFSSTLGATSDALMLSELYGAVTNRDIITGENAGYSVERRSGILGGFVGGLFGLKQLANSYAENVVTEAKIIHAGGSNSGPSTWNEFQSATKGMFSSRVKAARAWQAYKESPQRVVIVGETMDRVKVGAGKLPGAGILNDMPDFAGMGMNDYQVTNAMMRYNRKWILEQMRNGRLIIDIGNDPNRGVPSIFYQMERNMIRNYQRLHPTWGKVVHK